MAIGDLFGSYVGGMANQAQQSALDSLMNQQMANQQNFYNQGYVQNTAGGLAQLIGSHYGQLQGGYLQHGVSSQPCTPQDEPKQAQRKKLRGEPPDEFRATDGADYEDMMFAIPGWKRRLQKRYPEGMIIGGFVRRLAMEIDFWHANAAGLPA